MAIPTPTTAPAAAVLRATGRARHASANPSATLIPARATTIIGEPIVGIRMNGMNRLPMIAPAVFEASS